MILSTQKAVVSSTITKSAYVPVFQKFLDNIINHYKNNKEFRESLMVSLVNGYASKFGGVVNNPYGAKVLEFFSALATSGENSAFEFVSRNLCGVSLYHMQHLNKKQLTKPFIIIDQHEILTHLDEKLQGFVT